MAALRRGVAHYQGGTDNATVADATAAPVATASLPAAPSGLGQLLRGYGTSASTGYAAGPANPQYVAAAQNPKSSPATAMLGQFADYLSRSNRVDAVSRGPSLGARVLNFFTGRAGDTAIADHDAASQALRNPVVQQHLMNNPDQLALAEKDRLGYVQRPEFKEMLQHASNVSATAAASPKVTSDEHPHVVNKGTNAGVSADAAHASIAPQKYTEDEFVKTFSGIPTKTFALLFGSQLGHVRNPNEKAAVEVIDRLHGNYALADNKVKQMEADDAKAKEAGKSAIHSGYTMFGKNAYDMAKEERDKALAASMDALKALSGISQKPFQVPPTP